MTLAETCDIAYTLLLERVVADTRLTQQMALLAAASGAEVEIPSVDEAIRDFDAALNAEPEPVDPDRAALLEVLGVSGA